MGNPIAERLKERRVNFGPHQLEGGYNHLYSSIKSVKDLVLLIYRDDVNTKIFTMLHIVPQVVDLLTLDERVSVFHAIKQQVMDERMCNIGYSTSYADEEDTTTVAGAARSALGNHSRMKKLEDFLSLNLEQKFGKSRYDLFEEEKRWMEIPLEKRKDEEEHHKLMRLKDIYKIQEILRGTTEPTGILGRLLEESCRKCGEQEVYCGYTELGTGMAYYHNFWHLCLSCLDAKHLLYVVSYGNEVEGDENCPFCGYDWLRRPNENTQDN
ncbi:hypothetical protein DRN76_00615 [Methanosarcinales archaeon]|nr:MAG: hypothetical protein DRN76_00615 [Methanosarcinales archaeon]